MKADIILYNGHIYKSNTGREYAEAVAIKERTFICVGSFDDCIRYKSDKTEIIDLQGRLVIPGLIDGHTHPETIAKSRWRVQIPEFDNIEDLLCWVKSILQRKFRIFSERAILHCCLMKTVRIKNCWTSMCRTDP